MDSFDIEKYRLDLVLIRETAERIIKDFDLFGFDIVFSGNEDKAYEEMNKQLQPVFHELIYNNRQKLMRMLYIIDISEEKLSSTINKHPDEPMANIISHLVIERELQKVITRRYFSQKGKE
jgi:hypothetical protein